THRCHSAHDFLFQQRFELCSPRAKRPRGGTLFPPQLALIRAISSHRPRPPSSKRPRAAGWPVSSPFGPRERDPPQVPHLGTFFSSATRVTSRTLQVLPRRARRPTCR